MYWAISRGGPSPWDSMARIERLVAMDPQGVLATFSVRRPEAQHSPPSGDLAHQCFALASPAGKAKRIWHQNCAPDQNREDQAEFHEYRGSACGGDPASCRRSGLRRRVALILRRPHARPPGSPPGSAPPQRGPQGFCPGSWKLPGRRSPGFRLPPIFEVSSCRRSLDEWRKIQ